MIGTSAHTLSYLFNQHLNRNYYDYVNDYRIAEFKHLIAEDEYSKYTLSALAELCGSVPVLLSSVTLKRLRGLLPVNIFAVSEKRMNNCGILLLK